MKLYTWKLCALVPGITIDYSKIAIKYLTGMLFFSNILNISQHLHQIKNDYVFQPSLHLSHD